MKNTIVQQTFQNFKRLIKSINNSNLNQKHGYRQFGRNNSNLSKIRLGEFKNDKKVCRLSNI